MNPERIRALLAGITAGEWQLLERDPRAISVAGGAERIAAAWLTADAAFIAASPGIARYALELAAALDRISEGHAADYSSQQAIARAALAGLGSEGANG